MCSQKFRKFYMNTPVLESLFNNVAGLSIWHARPGTLLKRDSNTGFCIWNLRNFKSTYFEEHLRTSAPVSLQRLCSAIAFEYFWKKFCNITYMLNVVLIKYVTQKIDMVQ